jgi:hypothetical protein
MNDQIIISRGLFEELLEYFENRMDADYNYESGKHKPNREMKLYAELQERNENELNADMLMDNGTYE